MAAPLCLLEFGVADLFAQVSTTGYITLADRYGLLAALLNDCLSDDERAAIDRLLHAICKGRVKIVNDMAALPA